MSLVKHRFRKPDGSVSESRDWYARFTYKGRAHYFSTRTPNKTLAARIEAKRRQSLIEKGELGVISSVTIRTALEKYVHSMAHSGEIKNIKNHCNKLLGFKNGGRDADGEREKVDVHGLGPERPFESISTADIQQLVMARRAEGCSNATILHELSTLSQAIRLNKKIGNPVPAVQLRDIKRDNQIRPSKGRLRYLSGDEERRLLEALDPAQKIDGVGKHRAEVIRGFRQDMWDLVIVLLDTGARYSEVARLSWADVNLKDRTIALYRFKVKNESILQMTSRVHGVLSRRLAERDECQPNIFESKDGGARKYAPGAFVRACKRCGIKGITLHSLRHTFASRMVQQGLSLVEVQSLLGHSSPITSLRYAHLAPNQATSKAASILDRLNGGAGTTA